jgi:hypothetical protein
MTTPQPGRLVPLLRRGSRPTLLLLPGAGGGLNPYLRLAAALGQSHNVTALRAAGLVPTEEPEHGIAEMADAALRALEESGDIPGDRVGRELSRRPSSSPSPSEVSRRLCRYALTPPLNRSCAEEPLLRLSEPIVIRLALPR